MKYGELQRVTGKQIAHHSSTFIRIKCEYKKKCCFFRCECIFSLFVSHYYLHGELICAVCRIITAQKKCTTDRQKRIYLAKCTYLEACMARKLAEKAKLWNMKQRQMCKVRRKEMGEQTASRRERKRKRKIVNSIQQICVGKIATKLFDSTCEKLTSEI